MTELIEKDWFRASGGKKSILYTIKKNRGFRFVFFWRMVKVTKSKILRKLYTALMHKVAVENGIEIPTSVEIGPGFLMIHPTQITINSQAKIGKNLTMLKGATIGNIKSGKKMGAPHIGNNVYIGLNSSVVGGIEIGDDVLIAANTFVNFDVPSHSIVIGSPGVIHRKNDATVDYIVNPIT